MEKIRILLVDDHILTRMGLLSATQEEADMEVVAEADELEEAVAAYEKFSPNLVVLDFRLPNSDGPGVLKRLREKFGAVRCLMLSNSSAGDDVTRAIQAGAAGYVVKGMSLDVLLEAIRTVHAGGQYIPTEIAARFAGRAQLQLTEREMDVLRFMAKGRSNKEVASALDIVEGTVKLHVTSILAKLNVADRTQAVVLALRRNILPME